MRLSIVQLYMHLHLSSIYLFCQALIPEYNNLVESPTYKSNKREKINKYIFSVDSR